MKRLFFFIFSFIFFHIISYSQIDIENGVIAYYPFSGNSLDESGNGNDGIVHGAQLTYDRNGKLNNAYHFDGEDDYIIIKDNSKLRFSNSDYTISCWVKVDEFSDLIGHAILSKRSGPQQNGYLLHIAGYNHSRGFPQGSIIYIVSGGNDPFSISNNTIVTNRWTHIAITYNVSSGISKLFINGELNKETLLPAPKETCSSDLYIGKDSLTEGMIYTSISTNYTAGYHFKGSIDEIYFFNRNLSDETIKYLYQNNNINFFEINIFPNPNNGKFQISVKNAMPKKIKIYNIKGILIYDKLFSNDVFLHSLPSGIYFVQIIDNENETIFSKKIVITSTNRV